MDKQRLLNLLTKYENDECTEEEITILKTWFRDFPENEKENDLFVQEAEETVQDRLWNRITSEMEGVEIPNRINWWFKIAAAAIVGILIGVHWLESGKSDRPEHYSEIQFRSYDQSSVVYLPDSSMLILEPNSLVRYRQDFLNDRTVYLEGACLFHVKKKFPVNFQVRTKEQITTVTGTIFSIKAYPEDDEVTTHLLEGSVRITHEQNKESMNLMSNEIAVYSTLLGKFTKVDTIADIESHASESAHTELVFNATTYDEIFTKLEERFGIIVFVDRVNLKECFFSAKFQTEALEEILSILASINHFKYHITGNIVYIEGFEC